MSATGIKVAVVTGANKGIGFGVVKLLLQRWDGVVYATARDTERGQKAVQELEQFGNVKFHQLDIDSDESRRDFRDFILAEHGGIDVLVNNAAISFWPDSQETLVHQASETMRVNFFGTLALSRLLFPLLRKEARVVNVTSSLSHLSHINGREPESGELRRQLGSTDLTEKRLVELMEEFIARVKSGNYVAGGWPSHLPLYVVPKAGLSALTRVQQWKSDSERKEDNILINSVHPGFVDTDMTRHYGTLTIEQGSEAIAWLAMLPAGTDGPRGAYVWHDKTLIDWVTGDLPRPYAGQEEEVTGPLVGLFQSFQPEARGQDRLREPMKTDPKIMMSFSAAPIKPQGGPITVSPMDSIHCAELSPYLLPIKATTAIRGAMKY